MLAELPHLGQIIPVQIQGRLVEEIDKMRARMAVPKLVCKVSDAPGFGFVVSVQSCFCCEEHN
jgi:hypothetical protein